MKDETEEQREMSIGNRLMLLGHLLNGLALTLLSVGSILRDNEDLPLRLRNFENPQQGRSGNYWERD